MSDDRQLAKALRVLVEPAVTSLACDLEDLTARMAGRRRLITVLVDRDGGVDLDTVAEVSRVVGDVLDAPEADELLKGAYVLEVSSPGVDRPLTLPRHWRRNVGRLVAISMKAGHSVTGRISAAHDSSATVEVNGKNLDVAFADVAKALVQVEFRKDDLTEAGDQ